MAIDPTLRVLMVEDDEDDVQWVEETLKRAGFTIMVQRVDTAACAGR